MSKDHKDNQSGQTLTFNFSACSDRGLVRGNNEDSAYAGPRLLALADGMGGHAAGEVASQFLINSLRPLDSPLLDAPDMQERLTTLLATAMDKGNQSIAAHVDANPQFEGMGCTLSTLLMRGKDVALCHVGDSRGYLLREGKLTQITKDDTFVQSLVDEGRLDPAEVSGHPQRSLILKALTGRPVDPTLHTFTAQPGDRFLLCSDGLSDPVSFDTIQETLAENTPDQAARRLVELALRSGGPDNVTVVIGDVIELDAHSNSPLDSSISLPATPLLAGAIAGKADEDNRPDTAASRAAALDLHTTNRPVKLVPDMHDDPSADDAVQAAKKAAGKDSENVDSPSSSDASSPNAHNAKEPAKLAAAAGAGAGAGGAASSESASATPKKKRTGLIIALVVVVVLLIAMAVAAFLLWKSTTDSYYVGEKDNKVLIYNGKRDSLLGQTFNTEYQEICLSRTGDITLFTPGEAPKQEDTRNNAKAGQDCHRFSTEDLTPVARGAIADLPDGDYNEVIAQVKRLAERTLPVCVERKSDTRAPEDLTTPGVSCREVK